MNYTVLKRACNALNLTELQHFDIIISNHVCV